MILTVVILEAIVILVLLVKLRPKYDGSIVVKETDEKKTFSLEINADPDELDKKKKIVMQVKHFIEEVSRE